MAKDLEKFKTFLQQTGYRCAKKNGEPILVRNTSDPDVTYISAEEYLSLEAKGSAPEKPKKAKAEKKNLEEMTFQELKAYARDNEIPFSKTITKAGLLKKLQQ